MHKESESAQLLKAWKDAETAYREASAPFLAVGLALKADVLEPEKVLTVVDIRALAAPFEEMDRARQAYVESLSGDEMWLPNPGGADGYNSGPNPEPGPIH